MSRPHPMTSDPVVGGTGVRSERSESLATPKALLTTETETKPSNSGEAETPTTDRRMSVRTKRGNTIVNASRAERPVPAVPPLLYRVEEAAEALRLSRTAVYELIRSGRLHSVKAGSRRLVPVAALAEYVASLERAA